MIKSHQCQQLLSRYKKNSFLYDTFQIILRLQLAIPARPLSIYISFQTVDKNVMVTIAALSEAEKKSQHTLAKHRWYECQ